MRYIIILCYVLCAGCVVLKKKSDIGNAPNSFLDKKCETVGAAYSLKEITKSSLIVEKDIDPKEIQRGSQNPSVFIEKSLRKVGFFDLDQKEKYSRKYSLQFTNNIQDYDNWFQQSTLIVSLITVGILPGWGDGTYNITLNVFDSEGALLKTYTSGSVEYKFLHGLIFLPLNYHDNTFAKVEEDYTEKLTDGLIQKMVDDKLIACGN